MSSYPEVELVRRLLALAARYGIQELEASEDGLSVTLRAVEPGNAEDEAADRYLWRPPLWSDPRPAGCRPGGPLGGTRGVDAARPETVEPLLAPLTGIFYRQPSPEAPRFVEVGDTVEEGQTVAVIEAMKVFSEVRAECAGVVVEIVAQNGRLIHHGEPLLYIDPAATT